MKNIIDKAIDGDIEALEELLKQYHKMIYHYAWKMVNKNYDLAEEVTQLTKIRLFKSIKQFNRTCKFETWLYRIIHNVFLDVLKGNKRHYNNISLDFTFHNNDNDEYSDNPYLIDDTDVETDLIVKEELYLLNKYISDTLNKLNTSYREILWLFFIEGKSYKEISNIMQIAEGTVKSKLARAKEAFRKNSVK